MTDAQITEMLDALDSFARDVDEYEYGLPSYVLDVQSMIAIVRRHLPLPMAPVSDAVVSHGYPAVTGDQ